MPTSLSSRLLAPVALAACILAVLVVAMSSLGGDDSETRTAAATQQTTQRTSTSSSSKKQRSTYTVKSGDSLSLIAEKTGVPVEDLIRRNPGVDPQSLRTGQKLKLASR